MLADFYFLYFDIVKKFVLKKSDYYHKPNYFGDFSCGFKN